MGRGEIPVGCCQQPSGFVILIDRTVDAETVLAAIPVPAVWSQKLFVICVMKLLSGNNFPRGDILEQKETLYQVGPAIYVIERVFSEHRTPQDVVVEEIITSAKQEIEFGGAAKKMV